MAARTATKKTGANGKAEGDLKPIILKRLEDVEMEITIQGLTPVIPHKWSEKAKRQMPGHPDRDTHTKKGAREPEAEAEGCVYRLDDGRPGMPATAFKSAIVSACRFFEDLPMVQAKLLFHVVGQGPEQLVPIKGNPVLHEDTPRNSSGTADLRYRYYFEDWSAVLKIRFTAARISPESIMALVDAAGRVGVGDWRPGAPKSATGTFGTFRVANEI